MAVLPNTAGLEAEAVLLPEPVSGVEVQCMVAVLEVEGVRVERVPLET